MTLKMNEGNSIEKIDKANLTDQTKFRLNKLSMIENYFIKEIKATKLNSKNWSNYVAAFDYIDNILIVLSATIVGVSLISFTADIGAPADIASPSFTLIFSLITGISKLLLSTTRNKKKKHDKINVLAKSKLNSIETLVSQALIEIEISHEEFNTIYYNENDKYEIMKEAITTIKSSYELNKEDKKIKTTKL